MLVAIVGMAGAGKTEVSRVFQKHGWQRLRFGDVTDDELKRRGLERNEQHERVVRESIRKEHGMAAYAKFMIPKIDAALPHGNVVLDGLYSWEELLVLREHFGKKLVVLGVYTTRQLRYQRLTIRGERPLSFEESRSRDIAEIEKLNKAGPIALADHLVINDGSLKDLVHAVEKFIRRLSSS